VFYLTEVGKNFSHKGKKIEKKWKMDTHIKGRFMSTGSQWSQIVSKQGNGIFFAQ